MLTSLTIRGVVLIDRLDLSFGGGLCALTGETGAGKSILLDCLGLALGRRAEPRMIRSGATRASVTAGFVLAAAHPAVALLRDHDLPVADELLLRRVLSNDGRSRAYVNDEAVSVGLLNQIGGCLVEIYGQNDRQGLLDRATHRTALDLFGNLNNDVAKTRAAYDLWRNELERLADMTRSATRTDEREADLRFALDELDALDPQAGEDTALADRRALLMAAEKIADALSEATAKLTSEQAVDDQLQAARRLVARVAAAAPDQLNPVLGGLDRAVLEVDDAIGQIQAIVGDLDLEGGALEQVEQRLFALRAIARKHQVAVDQLPELATTLRAELDQLEAGGRALDDQRAKVAETDAAYQSAADILTRRRAKAARKLDTRIGKELGALGLRGARFRTRLTPLDKDGAGPHGFERVEFEVATVAGADFGPIQRIASGGELSRFMLALRVAIAEQGNAETLIFDEIDAGIGGAVADSVGQRLATLGAHSQVLVVTHQPQIAARSTHHYRVHKQSSDRKTETQVAVLSNDDRVEEIARMVAGAEITPEARAAARRLIDGAAETALV